jgi:hypothetical protein
MGCSQVARGCPATAILAIVFFVSPGSLHADTILPASNFSCNFCTGSAAQLPAVNGIEGVELTFIGGSSGADVIFSLDVIGTLGSDLPAGTSIPYTFSFNADSQNPGGTNIVFSNFFAQPPPLQEPNEYEGNPSNQISAITRDGNCAPTPSAPTNTHWCRSVQGSGTLVFPAGVPSGALLELGASIEIDTQNLFGGPFIDLNGTIDFNPVPEPRHPLLILLGLGLFLAVWPKLALGRKSQRLAG